MRKQPEATEALKQRIQVLLAFHPFFTIGKLREQLKLDGYTTASGGMLDYHYVSKMVHRVRTATLLKMRNETHEDRMIDFRETTNAMVEKLMEIVDEIPMSHWTYNQRRYPNHMERIKAAETIAKLKKSLIFVEEEVRAVRQPKITERLTFDPRSGKRSLTRTAPALEE